MKYSIRQNHLNKTMLFEDDIQVGEPNAPELEFWARIQELEKLCAEKNNLIGNFMQLAENSIDCIELLKNHIQELETKNKILIETGHWISQDEAHDLKVAVEEFLANQFFGPQEYKNLRAALDNCK